MRIPTRQYPPPARSHCRGPRLRSLPESEPERPHGGAAQDILDAAVEEAIGGSVFAARVNKARFPISRSSCWRRPARITKWRAGFPRAWSPRSAVRIWFKHLLQNKRATQLQRYAARLVKQFAFSAAAGLSIAHTQPCSPAGGCA